MSRVKLAVATTDDDHFRDLRLRGVQAEGIEPTWSMRHAAGTSSRTLQRDVDQERWTGLDQALQRTPTTA